MSDLSPEDFLNKKVNIIFEPMVSQMLVVKPDDPFKYMIDWLLTISGRHNKRNVEQSELVNLRKETEKLKKKYKPDDEENELSDEELQEDTKESQESVDKMISLQKSAPLNKCQRSSVCAEVYGVFNLKKEYQQKFVLKTDEQYKLMEEIVQKNILLQSLEKKDLKSVLDAMDIVYFQTGETVIKQGDYGDVLYVVEKGILDCYKVLHENEEAKHVKTYEAGESFGELALLYNTPRAATIVAREASTLLSLDRETFNYIVKDAAMKRRDRYESFLKSVDILKSMDNYEVSQVAEALKVKELRSGEYIIRQNEEGDSFYILEEGLAYASKICSPSNLLFF